MFHERSAGMKIRVLVALGFGCVLTFLVVSNPHAAQQSSGPSVNDATRALTILEQNCANSGCHGGPGAYSFDARDPQTLIAAKLIEPGSAAKSDVISRVEAGVMPLGGYQGRAGTKLPETDIQTLKRWIDGGAVLPARTASNTGRRFISEQDTLQTIARDLEAAPEVDRRYYRYFSLANLWNAPDVDANEIAMYQTAVGRLANHLSWQKEIAAPQPIGPDGALLRIDLRKYGWTIPVWNDLVATYPYGIVRNDLRDQAERVRALSGAIPAFVRGDWFTAKASVAPLYTRLLQLPDTVEALERRLSIDSMANVRSNRARRFGVLDSGVSKNNRAMERHATPFGAYWKSYDFNGSRIEQNIFRDPVHLTPDGGEMIFNLPNGLQGYFIADSQGRRIDDAPATIVRDKTNPDDPVVHNGRSCMGCHIKGMNSFRDDVAPSLQTRAGAVFDMKTATALYPGQAELDQLLAADNARFAAAIRQGGGSLPGGASAEPINQLARRYERALNVEQASAELDIQNAADLQKRIASSVEIQRQGFDPLLGPKGGIQRDTWEQGFGRLAQELGIGGSAFPDALLNIPSGTTMRLELVNMLNPRTAKQGDIVWFRAADNLMVRGKTAIAKGSLVRGLVTQIQPGGGPNGGPGVQLTVDQALPKNGTGVRLPPAIITMKDATGSPNMSSMIGGAAQLANALNGAARSAGGGGMMGGMAGGMMGGMAPTMGPPQNAAPAQPSSMLPAGSTFEAKF